MKNGNGLPLRDIRSEARRVQFGGNGGEADQVVDDDMNGASDGIALQVGVIQSLRPNALAGKSAIAVYQQRQEFSLATVSPAILFGASAAHSNRIYRLQVAGIGYEVDADLGASARDVFPSCSHVVLNIAAPKDAARVNIFKTRKDFLRRTPSDMHYHVEPATVAHAHNQLRGSALACLFQYFVDQGQQGSHSFQREALGPQITLLQNLFEQIGANQQIEHMFLINGSGFAFHALLNPAPAFDVGDVHEISANRAAIIASGLASNFAGELQFRVRLRLQKPERIQVGFEISPPPEGVQYAFSILRRRFQHPCSRRDFASSCGHKSVY